MSYHKSFIIITIIILSIVSSFAVSAQTETFNGQLSAGDGVSTHELCAENGEDYAQTFSLQVSETAEYTLSALVDGTSTKGNWFFAMLDDSPEFTSDNYIMYASSYGESDTVILTAEQDYYLNVMGCSYLEQQNYPMQFAFELEGSGDIAVNGATQVVSAGN